MDGQEEKILKSPTSVEDMNTQEQKKQILTEPRSLPSPLKQQTSVLIQKITHLPSVLMRLVSRPDNTLEQQAEIERLVDQLVQDAQGVLDNNQVDSYLDSKNSSDFLNGVLNNSSTDESASSMDKFMSGSLDFITEPQLGSSIFMEEDNFTEEQFMSYFDLDMPNYNATVQSGALKEEVSEEKVVAEYEEEQEVDALPPGTYDLIELDSMEILAEHTHFCDVCGKGFKRDANLRMHMRGHGDEYKTAAALSKPRVQQELDEQQKRRSKRYSCPFMGCKRHKLHPKFTPLKTVLCVKNHYRRSHCPKMLTCSKCRSKKFSVVADLRTHEKHCGQEKWMCSCGTSFTRKDKLLGHISLFFGHRPLVSSPCDQKTVSKQPIVVPVCIEEPVFLDQNWSGSRVVFTTQQ